MIPKRIQDRVKLLRDRRTYSTRELSKILCVHMTTTQKWCRCGMRPIDPDTVPSVFFGAEVRRFLSERRGKVKLGIGEFYCVRCRAPRRPQVGTFRAIETGRTIGRNSEQIELQGTCRICQGKLRRFSTAKDFKQVKKAMTGEE